MSSGRVDLSGTFGTDTPLIGMVHLPPLPGTPEYEGDRHALRGAALADALTLLDSGFDGLLVENFGDTPFFPDDVPKHTVAEMTAIVRELGIGIDRPFGVNVLRNDAEAALSIAAATGGSFIRVNVHTGHRITDQGRLDGVAHETMRLRERIDADVSVFADIDSKHSGSPVERPIEDLAREAIERGLADGLIVSGPSTGEATAVEDIERVVAARDGTDADIPVFVGSGVTTENAPELLSIADGAIVGTAVKAGGETTNPVDAERAAALVDAVRE